MYDKELVLEILKNIIWSIDQVTKRFQAIESSDDFIKDDNGLEKLDSICKLITGKGILPNG
jgi:hypothetical protein